MRERRWTRQVPFAGIGKDERGRTARHYSTRGKIRPFVHHGDTEAQRGKQKTQSLKREREKKENPVSQCLRGEVLYGCGMTWPQKWLFFFFFFFVSSDWSTTMGLVWLGLAPVSV